MRLLEFLTILELLTFPFLSADNMTGDNRKLPLNQRMADGCRASGVTCIVM
jgi:hypothetical protein